MKLKKEEQKKTEQRRQSSQRMDFMLLLLLRIRDNENNKIVTFLSSKARLHLKKNLTISFISVLVLIGSSTASKLLFDSQRHQTTMRGHTSQIRRAVKRTKNAHKWSVHWARRRKKMKTKAKFKKNYVNFMSSKCVKTMVSLIWRHAINSFRQIELDKWAKHARAFFPWKMAILFRP